MEPVERLDFHDRAGTTFGVAAGDGAPYDNIIIKKRHHPAALNLSSVPSGGPCSARDS
jgi:hypothetical protein